MGSLLKFWHIKSAGKKDLSNEKSIGELSVHNCSSENETDNGQIKENGIFGKSGITNGICIKDVPMSKELNYSAKSITNNLDLDVNGGDKNKDSESLGLLDGNGLTNGNGLTIVRGRISNNFNNKNKHNRLSIKEQRIKTFQAKKIKNRIFGLIIVLMLILLPLNMYFWDFDKTEFNEIIIDGQFNDWDNNEFHLDLTFDIENNVNIDMVRYDLKQDAEFYNFYVEVYGTMFNGQDIEIDNGVMAGFDTLNIYIDSDNDKCTGYLVKDLGADYLFQVSGYNNVIYKSSFKDFNDLNDLYDLDDLDDLDELNELNEINSGYDWNSWEKTNSHFTTGIKGKRFEGQVPVNAIQNVNKDILVLYQLQDSSGNVDVSDSIIGPENKLLDISYKSLEKDVIEKDSGFIHLSTLNINPVGTNVKLNSISFDILGNCDYSDFKELNLQLGTECEIIGELSNDKVEFIIEEPLSVSNNENKQLNLNLELAEGVKNSKVIDLEISNIDYSSNDPNLPVIISSDTHLKYIGEAPAEVVIDGAFGDWIDKQVYVDKDLKQIQNSNVDIKEYQISTSPDMLSFCFVVSGQVLEGTYSPIESNYKLIKEPEQEVDIDSQQKPRLEPTDNDHLKMDELNSNLDLLGLDSAYIFIDADNNIRSGYYLPSEALGAEYMIEITGKAGRVISNKYFEYNGNGDDQSSWVWSDLGFVKVGKDDKRLEAQVPFSKLGIKEDSGFELFFHISSWSSSISSHDSLDQNEDRTNIIQINGFDSETEQEIHIIRTKDHDFEKYSSGKLAGTRSRANYLKEVVNVTGDWADDRFGFNVSYSEDLNLDGYSDVLIGAPFNDTSGADAGAAYIFFGYPSIVLNNLNPSNANVSLFGSSPGENFGWSVACTNDLNNDSTGDVLIGAPGAGSGNGAAFIFYGESIISEAKSDAELYSATESNVTLYGGASGDEFGHSVTGVGDLNKDNLEDFLVGAPGNDSNTGSAYLYHGSTELKQDILVNQSGAVMHGEANGDRFGSSVSSAGDFNNDSFPDFVIGSPGYDSGSGRAYVFYGSKTMESWTENLQLAHWDEESGASMNPPGYGIYKGQFLAQSFTPAIDYRITKVALFIADTGTSGNLVISIQGDSSGPNGTILTSAPSINSGPTSLTWVEFEFTQPVLLTANTKYWLVATGDGKNALNCWEWLEDENSGTDFPGGNGAFSGGAGKSWTQDPTTHDYLFKVYGQLSEHLRKNLTCTGGSVNDHLGWSVAGIEDHDNDGFDDIIICAPNTTNGSAYIINGDSNNYNITVSGTPWANETKFLYWETGGNMEIAIYNDTMGSEQTLAQSFIPAFDYNLTKISIFVERVGTPGTLTVKLMGSSGSPPNSVPDYNVLATAPSISSGKRSYAWMNFSLTTPYVVKANTEYYIVAEGTGQNTANCWAWYTQGVGGFSYGDYAFKQSGGWIAGARDCYFKVYGKPRAVEPDITLQGNPKENFGWSVCGASDFNDDGYPDLIVGAPQNDSSDGSKNAAGAVFIFYGGSSFVNDSCINADNVSYGENTNDNFGWSVHSAGDVNGDNYLDIIVGAPKFDNNSYTDAGKIYILSTDVKHTIPEYSQIIIPILFLFMLITYVRNNAHKTQVNTKPKRNKGVRW
jgi:hypothetical protein